MKEIIEQYGKMLIESLILGMLLLLIFAGVEDEDGNKGVLQIIGAGIHEETNDYTSYTDFDTYETDSYKRAPEIEYSGGNFSIGEWNLCDYITATGYAGNEVPIKIISVVDRTGRELPVIDEQRVYFNTAGVYVVTIKAVDNTKKETIDTIKIPVNEG